MGKVKSAIITSLLVIAILVAAFFGVASFNVSKTQRYNSIASGIHLGGEYSGYAYATLYPEGVISAQDYNFLDEDDAKEYRAEAGVYVGNDVDVEDLKTKVAADAEKINKRFSDKGLSSYTVTVEDGITVRVAVPTNYTYAAYTGANASGRSTDYSVASGTLSYLTADGYMMLRTTDSTASSTDTATTGSARKDEFTDTVTVNGSSTYSLTGYTEDVNAFFKGVNSFTVGSTSVISFDLTEKGRERMQEITSYVANTSSQTLYVFLGETQMLQVSCTEAIDSDVLQFTSSDANSAQNSAIALHSAINGGALELSYEEIDTVYSSVATGGEYAAVLAVCACLVIMIAVIVALVVKYKKLGIVVGLNVLVYALVLLYALFLLKVQVTAAVLVTAVAGLALLAFTNVYVFEEVRRQCKTGKTLQSAVKAAYKRTVLPVVDFHVVLFVLALLLAFVAGGEVAACGHVLVVAVLSSYVLYWFTRFMWYVTSSQVKDKFRFGGFKREVYGDD